MIGKNYKLIIRKKWRFIVMLKKEGNGLNSFVFIVAGDNSIIIYYVLDFTSIESLKSIALH